MSEWVMPLIIACLGIGGIGAFFTARAANRTARTGAETEANRQLLALVEAIQEERSLEKAEFKADRAELRQAAEYATGALYEERKWSATLEEWAARGAPPPPPTRKRNTADN